MKIIKAKNEQPKPKDFYLRAQVTRFIRNRLPDEKILTFFVCLKEVLFVCLFYQYYVLALVGAFSWTFRAFLLLDARSYKLPLTLGVKCISVKRFPMWGIIDQMRDKSPTFLSFSRWFKEQNLTQDSVIHYLRVLEPGHLEVDYAITTFFENKRFSRSLANGPITFKILRPGSCVAR